MDIRAIRATAEDLALVDMDRPLNLIKGAAAAGTEEGTVAGAVTEGIFTATAIVGAGAPIMDID